MAPSRRSGAASLASGLSRYDALLLTALIWFLAKFLRYAFPPLFEPFQGTYGVSNAVLGTAFTGFMLMYAAMQFPSGVLADRIGSVSVITAGVVLASLSALVLLLESPFVVLVGVMVLIGAGTGVHKTVAIRLLSRAYPARTGRALGVLDSIGAFGGVVAPVAVVFFAGVSVVPFIETGWRQLFFLAGIAGLALGGAFALVVPKRLPSAARGADAADDDSTRGGESDSPPKGLRQYGALFHDRYFTVFVLATVCFSFTYNGLVAFAPLYLIEEGGLEVATANVLYGALFAVSLVQVVTGELGDRLGTLPVIVGTLTLSSVAMVTFVLTTGTGSALILGGALVAVGLGAHGYRPVRGAYLMSAIPPAIAGGSLGVVRTLLMGAGALSPAVVGILADLSSFRVAFSLLTVSMCVATVLCGLLLAVGATTFTVGGDSSG